MFWPSWESSTGEGESELIGLKAVGSLAGGGRTMVCMKMRSKRKKGFTTGEVSRLFDIPQRTVIRYFDKGIFTGSKHPSTGRRVIDLESVKAFEALKHEQIMAVRKVIDDLAKR